MSGVYTGYLAPILLLATLLVAFPSQSTCKTVIALNYINTMDYDYYLSNIGDSYWGDLIFESASGNTESFWAALAFSDADHDHGVVSLLKDKSSSTTSTTTHHFTSDAYNANSEIELNENAKIYIEKVSPSFKSYIHSVYLKTTTSKLYKIKSLGTTSSSATWKFEDDCSSYLSGDNDELAKISPSDDTNRCLVAIHPDDGVVYFINVHSGDVVTSKGNDCDDYDEATSPSSCLLDWKGLDEADVKFSMIPLGETGYFQDLDVEAFFVVSSLDNDLQILSNFDGGDIEFSTDTRFFIETTEVSTGIYTHELILQYYLDESEDPTLVSIKELTLSTNDSAYLILNSLCELKLQDGDGTAATIYEAIDTDTNCVVGFYDEAELKIFDYYDAIQLYSINDMCDELDLAYCSLNYGCDDDEVTESSYVSFFTATESEVKTEKLVKNQQYPMKFLNQKQEKPRM